MLNLEERFMIRDLYRKGVSISAIARRTGRDRKTIRKIITGELVTKPVRRKRRQATKLTP
jgi:transposase